MVTDKGANFTLALMRHMCQLLGVRQLFTTIYHPQTDGLVERMNQTIKDLLKKTAFSSQWDNYLDLLGFALWETPQASTGLAHFELIFGRLSHDLMQVLQN